MSEPKDAKIVLLRSGVMHFEMLDAVQRHLSHGHHTIVIREIEPKYDTVHIEPPAFQPIGVPRYLPVPPPLRYKLVLAIAAIARGARA